MKWRQQEHGDGGGFGGSMRAAAGRRGLRSSPSASVGGSDGGDDGR